MPFDGTDFNPRHYDDRPSRPGISSKQVAAAAIGVCTGLAMILVGPEYALPVGSVALAVLLSSRHWMPFYTRATSRPEIIWAIAIGTACAFPVWWLFLIPAGFAKLGAWSQFRYSLWRQAKHGPRVLKIDGRRIECWLHRDGSTTVSYV